MRTMTFYTYPRLDDFNTQAYAEHCEKYGLEPHKYGFVIRYIDETTKLFSFNFETQEQKLIDDNYQAMKVEMTAEVCYLSDTSVLEIQHIDGSVDESLDSIYETERVCNGLCESMLVRIV